MRFKYRFNKILNNLPLTTNQRNVIIFRYVNIVSSLEVSYYINSFIFNILTWLITLGSIATSVTAAVGKNNSQDINSPIYWAVVITPLIVAFSNKWLYIFNVHKKYLESIKTLEKLYSEGWSFAAGVGIYSDGDYTAKFMLFCTRVENIKLKTTKIMLNIKSNDGTGDSSAVVAEDDNVNSDAQSGSTSRAPPKRRKKKRPADQKPLLNEQVDLTLMV
jgi:hypothetical protein